MNNLSHSEYGKTIEEATRPIYWNLPSVLNQFIMYGLLLISSAIIINALFHRFKMWSKYQKPSKDLLDNLIQNLTTNVVLQKKVSRDKQAGVFHALIYLGFLALTLTTTTVFLHHDFNLNIYVGKFYLGLTLLSDTFGFLFLLGLLLASQRRYLERPDKLHSNFNDGFMLSLLSLMIIQGFILEGLRIKSTVDIWSHYSYVGLLVSKFFWGISDVSASRLHFITWWFHTITVFTFIALIPYTKFFHIISSSLNLSFQNRKKPKGKMSSPGDLEVLMEAAANSDGEFNLGISTIKDLGFKQRLELDACTSCGRCQEVCPAYNSGKMLSPKWLILDTRDHLLSLESKNPKENATNFFHKINSLLLDSFLLYQSPSLAKATIRRANNQNVQNSAANLIGLSEDALLAGEVMKEDVFWSCTTCRACVEVCPVGIDHVDYITQTRQNLLLIQGKVPHETQSTLRALESKGTPVGTNEERTDWTTGLDIKFLKSGDQIDVLYWVGCISAFDSRKQKIAKSMVEILNKSGVSWGMLGNLERCTGDPARRLGDENTFQSLAKQNITTFKSVNFKTIVTHCPHCLNTIKNEYPEFGHISESNVRILHHSTYIAELLANNKITIDKSRDNNDTITFHDPCYLGRYNDEYDSPREVIVSLGRKKMTEMKSNKQKSMCCGAGGGHYWHDMKVGERVNKQRVAEAVETSSNIIASACPFCLQMLEDGVKLNNTEESIEVRDISELVCEQLA